MEHSHAAEHHLVEQYLLGELSPEARDEFEEHYFDCQTCATELQATSRFLQAAREELPKMEPLGASSALQFPARARKYIQLRQVFALSALAASLLVVIYQNTVTLPGLRAEIARLDTPEVLPSLSLVGGNSRGGNMPSAGKDGAHSLLLQVDIPTERRFSSYTCSLYSAQHQLAWIVPVSAPEAMDTVSIRVPLTRISDGIYSLEVRGVQSPGTTSSFPGVELASYRFSVKDGKTAAR